MYIRIKFLGVCDVICSWFGRVLIKSIFCLARTERGVIARLRLQNIVGKKHKSISQSFGIFSCTTGVVCRKHFEIFLCMPF